MLEDQNLSGFQKEKKQINTRNVFDPIKLAIDVYDRKMFTFLSFVNYFRKIMLFFGQWRHFPHWYP